MALTSKSQAAQDDFLCLPSCMLGNHSATELHPLPFTGALQARLSLMNHTPAAISALGGPH